MAVKKPNLLALLTPTNVLLAALIGTISWIGASQAESIKFLQTGVNQALTQGAALMERVNGLMREQGDRKSEIVQINQRIDKLMEKM